MKIYLLTFKQIRFLEKYHRDYPFNLIDWTISRVLKVGSYNDKERITINEHIEMWKEHRKKFD